MSHIAYDQCTILVVLCQPLFALVAYECALYVNEHTVLALAGYCTPTICTLWSVHVVFTREVIPYTVSTVSEFPASLKLEAAVLRVVA